MPNYVINKVEIIGHDDHIKSVLDTIQSTDEDGELIALDYDKIIPMPKELRNVTSPVNIISEKKYKEQERRFKKIDENPENKFKNPFFRRDITKKMQADYLERFGHDNWYDWAIENWGTKWGSFDTELVSHDPVSDKPNFSHVTIIYQTAWSSGATVIGKLSYLFPSVTIKLTYADEDAGSNCGIITFKGGYQIDSETFFPDYGGDFAMEIYFSLWGGEENWKKIDGEWQYVWEDC